ncbi:hypothetical protein ND861_05795 [Leptospira sp. 2 VSF19]|uniref:Uncharacterized protein n=1 Tax=Leptospira soteropolitanensis TaxID=2950025 RepID=A0AAW5VJ52_9LEPT|nr:hypothetical protein [Leptospira soteropolitanensis]MCW7492167.1 hypothetical protein [Leptospira soteropolitanensis]MCW7499749.1 hypothetical protein [Leptospira soteropolitanensis]MCW7522000.1 hypothetical protein [Leptospira soteropolitanensis]MCW7525854.1 hypothetical protein [Leptospira soteropolitanensis]MCW7530032.1 hypothetical protein [Leptospira soteropolitanensis]
MKRIYLLFVLCWGVSLGSKPIEDKDIYSSVVNWTNLLISSSVKETIPKIVFDEDDPEFSGKNTATSQGKAHSLARKKAKEKLKIRLSQRLESILFNADYTVYEYTQVNPQARLRLNSYIGSEKEEYDFQFIKNVLEAKASLTLKGKEGILSHIPIEYGRESIPEFSEEVVPVEFSGLVIDARHLNLKKALYPKIQTDRGLDIYSPLYVKEAYAIETGYIVYKEDQTGKGVEAKVGKNPYFVLALGTAGKNQTDLVIPTDEAAKFLSHPESRKNLTRCRVLILVSQ